MRVLALLIVLSTLVSMAPASPSPDVFWIDSYGKLRWEYEMARLDNFAIRLLHEPNHTGYIYIKVGKHSCANEAIAHAVKARNYIINVRQIPWNRVAFRDLGYSDSFEVKLWLFPSGQPPLFFPEYEPATSAHVIEPCLKRKKRR